MLSLPRVLLTLSGAAAAAFLVAWLEGISVAHGLRDAGASMGTSNLADFVLAPFARDERDDVLALLPPLTSAVETWLKEGVEKAMNLHNRVPEAGE